MKGVISSFQSLGTVDGPGVRSVVFAAGCPLRCAYCHNPETWEKKGEEWEAAALAEKIFRFYPYIKNGGVTFSGGEPLMQGEFFCELANLLKEKNLSVALDTSGNWRDDFTVALLDACDIVLLDIKFTSEEEYARYTRGSLEKAMDFLALSAAKKKRVWIRQVVLEGVNDGEENAEKLKRLLAPFSGAIERIQLLPFRKICQSKYDRMNLVFPCKNLAETSQITLDRMNAVLQAKD